MSRPPPSRLWSSPSPPTRPRPLKNKLTVTVKLISEDEIISATDLIVLNVISLKIT